MTRPISFAITGRVGAARRGQLQTRHGVVQTPTFMPVGTLASVKGLDTDDLASLNVGMMLSNAYHLALRPGAVTVRELGGLHAFMGNHAGAILTDSGGFQVYSLAHARRVTDDGVRFRSHIDGAAMTLTPESLTALQEDLRPDIAMVLDECPPAQAPRPEVERAVARCTAWAKRCLAARTRDDVAWFGIVQGALFRDVRLRHAEAIGELDFDGVAIGGVSVGESSEEIARVVYETAPALPSDKPRYLMGVGTPQDLVRGVAAGVDLFDCVMPSRNARNGQLFTSQGKLNIKGAHHRHSDLPLDPACPCRTCARYSRGYLRHLFVAKELSFYRLATLHNVTYYLELMRHVRADLEATAFDEAAWLARLQGGG